MFDLEVKKRSNISFFNKCVKPLRRCHFSAKESSMILIFWILQHAPIHRSKESTNRLAKKGVFFCLISVTKSFQFSFSFYCKCVLLQLSRKILSPQRK